MSNDLQKIINTLSWDKLDLIPCVVQDCRAGEVLMLAYMDKEALIRSIKTGIAHYFSRSKQRIWKKGETSGNIQVIKEILFDCDKDSILLKVDQKGYACHTGNKTCFFNSLDVLTMHENTDSIDITNSSYSLLKYGVLDTLYHIILEKRFHDPNLSYTANLFNKGDNAIAKKVIEESGEFCFAFKDANIDEMIYECADLLYHILVALAKNGVSPDRVYKELERRLGVSGIEEKQNRNKK
ncbi:bifunctional phosphoribosyl-AMP cyclohydrolase/phosphoribosyl-ATP diphosphatase HisIE [Helicobacter muridarum]|uniref:Histidine biosynthesis bifunctional protein HisIE n=1 Tax=Helicobacter muridarum TaxID=216 RepID=A0A099TY29_9HELI|nr:bifunctional phosphoribosyl-AMP cyclohydrolase/phosphoribosyl-ATP diphosphatase HisIE [Helicobacter muridarum]TLE00837.1 bifunctional phosphoribosyl-AMP cyclohydrolase/phosphoribosyl-ATP diphosphatase HisIE [Helicobacter muridarum]STQ86601.1 histidine biosynthesis [Helicobacter muridarum]